MRRVVNNEIGKVLCVGAVSWGGMRVKRSNDLMSAALYDQPVLNNGLYKYGHGEIYDWLQGSTAPKPMLSSLVNEMEKRVNEVLSE